MGAVAAAAVPLSEQFLGERERAHRAIGDAMKELLRRKGNTVDPVELERLTDLFKQLEHKDVELKAIEVQELLDSAAVRDAVARLRSTTDKLESTAQEMKQAVDAVRKATQVLGFVDAILGAVGFLRGA